MKNKKELKEIANKIVELQAKVYACQLRGDIEGAARVNKALRFGKDYFRKVSKKGRN